MVAHKRCWSIGKYGSGVWEIPWAKRRSSSQETWSLEIDSEEIRNDTNEHNASPFSTCFNSCQRRLVLPFSGRSRPLPFTSSSEMDLTLIYGSSHYNLAASGIFFLRVREIISSSLCERLGIDYGTTPPENFPARPHTPRPFTPWSSGRFYFAVLLCRK